MIVGLVELFDQEIAAFVDAASATPGHRESLVLEPLSRLMFERFDVTRAGDRRLSRALVAALVPLYASEPQDVFEHHLRAWVDGVTDRVRLLLGEAAHEAAANPLLNQPELLLILERLDRDRLRLQEAWPTDLAAPQWLEDLASRWGVRL